MDMHAFHMYMVKGIQENNGWICDNHIGSRGKRNGIENFVPYFDFQRSVYKWFWYISEFDLGMYFDTSGMD